jgi:zinc protease
MKAIVRVALAAACLGQAVPAFAEPVVVAQRTPGGLGFRQVFMPDDTHQALNFAWRDGSAVALPGKEALADLGPALMMEGPEGSSQSAMLEQLSDLQASMGLRGTASFIGGHLSAPLARFAEAGEILARVLDDPALPQDKLARLQKNRAAASQQASETAETLAQRLFDGLLLEDGPYRRLLMGEPSMFAQVTRADIVAWRRAILVRDGIVIVTAGPMGADEIGRAIDRIFGGLPASGRVPARPAPVFRPSGQLVVVERSTVQTAVIAGGLTGLAVTPDLARAEIAVSVLGGGFTGRLMKAVRERLGATYGVSIALQPIDADTRVLAIRSAVANDKSREALAAIRGEYSRYIAEGPTELEIEPRKQIFINRANEMLRRAPATGAGLITAALHDFPDDFLMTYASRIRSYDGAAIKADIRANFPKPPLTIVIVTPSADGLEADCIIKAAAEIARCQR